MCLLELVLNVYYMPHTVSTIIHVGVLFLCQNLKVKLNFTSTVCISIATSFTGKNSKLTDYEIFYVLDKMLLLCIRVFTRLNFEFIFAELSLSLECLLLYNTLF